MYNIKELSWGFLSILHNNPPCSNTAEYYVNTSTSSVVPASPQLPHTESKVICLFFKSNTGDISANENNVAISISGPEWDI